MNSGQAFFVLRKLFPVLLVSAVLLSSSVGCQTTEKSLAPSSQMPQILDPTFSIQKANVEGVNIIPVMYSRKIVFLNREITDVLTLGGERIGRLPSGQVQVEFHLLNPTSEELWLDWKTAFYDRSNSLVEETEWDSAQFPAKQAKMLKANSIRRDVENFTVILRISPSAEKYEAALRAAEAKKAQEEAQEKIAKTQETIDKLADTAQKVMEIPQKMKDFKSGKQNTQSK